MSDSTYNYKVIIEVSDVATLCVVKVGQSKPNTYTEIISNLEKSIEFYKQKQAMQGDEI